MKRRCETYTQAGITPLLPPPFRQHNQGHQAPQQYPIIQERLLHLSIHFVPGPAARMPLAWQIMPTMLSFSLGFRFPSPHLRPYPYLEIAGAVEADLDTTHGAHGIMLGNAGRLLGVGLLASSETAHGR